MDEFKLEIPNNNLSYLDIATSFLKIISSHIPSISEKFLEEMEVVVSEASTNALKHCDKTINVPIQLFFRIHPQFLEFQVINSGHNNFIKTLLEPEINFRLEGNGNGAYIMKALTNELYAENRENEFHITLKKNY